MAIRWFELRAREPILIGTGRTGASLRTTLPYIPGRALRGAWAERLIEAGTPDIPAVVRTIRFGNLFPAESRPGTTLAYASPALLSMMTCKRVPGFQSDAGERAGHGVLDTLIPLLAYRILEETAGRLPVPFAIGCKECAAASQAEARDLGRMEPLDGFFAAYRTGPAFARVRPRYHTHTRVALSPHRRAAAEGMIYTTTALAPSDATGDCADAAPVVYVGRVAGPAERLDELLEAVRETAIGGMRTRGYGAVEVRELALELPPVEERVRRFNDCLATLWSDLRRLAANRDALPTTPPGRYFSVDLLAPGVFRERGLPTLLPSLTPRHPPPAEPVLWLTRPDTAAGWSEAWGLPKPTALAARMGSTYVYRWTGPDADAALVDFVAGLEDRGVGERTDEGFGECWICHPFHLEVEVR